MILSIIVTYSIACICASALLWACLKVASKADDDMGAG